MEHRNLGTSGLKVPTLCLGTMTFGEADEKSFMHGVGCDEATSFSIMSAAVERGVSFFDTADVYGQDGLTERVVGNWLAQDKRRDQVILATKFRFRMQPGPNGSGASRFRIVKAVDESLRRLKTDHIDLYQIHMQDLDTPEEETLGALDDLVRSGKVLYLGASNYTAYRLADSWWLGEVKGLHRFISLQAQYSLLERGVERELVPACARFGLGILPWAPLAGGFLSGKYRPGQEPPKSTRLGRSQERWSRYDHERGWKVLAATEAVAQEVQSTPSAVALAWLLAKPAVTSVIFGARSVAQLEDNLAAASLKLTSDQLRRLDEASAFDLGYPYDFIHRIQGRW